MWIATSLFKAPRNDGIKMSVSDNLASLRIKISKATQVAGRTASDVRLVAVSKKQPMDKIHAALAAGQRVFGENRVQEAQEHWTEIKSSGACADLRLHLIGPLQTNKAKDAVALFDVIETLDREKLARKLGEEIRAQGKALPCFIQVNTGAEPQKAGIAPSALDDFLDFCRAECGLNITGLMCIPPLEEPAALHFAFLKKLAGRFKLPHLSMGMSGDFEKAIALGATHIRIGTALFGVRHEC